MAFGKWGVRRQPEKSQPRPPLLQMDKGKLPLLLLACVIVLYSALDFQLSSSFKSLPSPLLGGDFYFQLGAVSHMYRTLPTEWFSSTNGIGDRPGYLPVYGIITTVFGKIFGLSPMDAMLKVDIILVPLSLILFFMFFKELFGDSWLGLAGAISSVGYTSFPLLKYTPFTAVIMVPLFLYSCVLFFRKQDARNSILLGITYGLVSLSHGTGFIFSTIFLAVMFGYMLLSKRKEIKITAEYIISKKYFICAFLIGFLIAQAYWFGPIFVYHGNAGLGSLIWGYEDLGNWVVQESTLFNYLGSIFFDTTSIFRIAVGVLSLLGVLLLVKKYKKLEEHETFAALFFGTSVLLTFSYFVTMPVLGTHFAPNYLLELYLVPAAIVLFVIGLKYVHEKLNRTRYVAIAFAILWLLHMSAVYGGWSNGPWIANGQAPLPQFYLQLQQWLVQNTSVHDRVLSNNELGFAVNALSGNDILMTRRAQNDAFADFDQYQRDAIIILYGNNTAKKIELMKKYNVKYLYFDYNWYAMLQYDFDPPLLFYSAENAKELDENGVKYTRKFDWVDPSVRSSEVRQFDVLYVQPENNDQTGKGPWKDDIDYLLTPVWSYNDGNHTISALYRVSG